MAIEWDEEAAGHIWDRDRRITTQEATEAVEDVDALLFDPDPTSRSGLTARFVGYSATRQQILCVIVLHGTDIDWLGVTAFPANSTYRRRYKEGTT